MVAKNLVCKEQVVSEEVVRESWSVDTTLHKDEEWRVAQLEISRSRRSWIGRGRIRSRAWSTSASIHLGGWTGRRIFERYLCV